MMTPTRNQLFTVFAVILALLLAACANEERPTVVVWQPKWEAVVGSVPDAAVVGESPSDQLCNDTLAALRAQRPGLDPTPDPAVDDAVFDWFGIAEDAFFECPPRGDEIGTFAEAYEDLARLAAEVDLVLNMDR